MYYVCVVCVGVAGRFGDYSSSSQYDTPDARLQLPTPGNVHEKLNKGKANNSIPPRTTP